MKEEELKKRIEEILDHGLAAYPDPSEYEENCQRNTAETIVRFIQENFVPKENKKFVNIYEDNNGRYISDQTFKTFEEAYKKRDQFANYISTAELLD